MRTQYAAVMCFLLTMLTAHSASAATEAESAENALTLTQILDGTDALDAASEFSAEDRAVYAVVDGTPQDAQQFCSQVDALVKKYELVFAKGWIVQLTIPDADGQAMAVCSL